MESNTRSPIFSGFGELLEGIVTVRAFSAEQKFLDGLHQKIDQTTKVGVSLFILLPSTRLTDEYLPNIDVVQLLDDEPLAAPEFRLPRCRRRAHHDALRAFGLGERGNCGYVYHFCDGIHDQYILGLSVLDSARARSQVRLPPHPYLLPIDPIHMSHDAHVIEIAGCIAPLNVWSNTSTFHKNLPQSSKTTARPPAYWPSSEGENLIVVENLDIKYAPELPPVLHDVSFSLKAKERIGLLGRTGSGKSTLAMSILRFVSTLVHLVRGEGSGINVVSLGGCLGCVSGRSCGRKNFGGWD